MGRYIGRDNPYGLFEKQILTILNDGSRDYRLTYQVSDSASILVVSNGAVLEPNSPDGGGYTVVGGGRFLRFDDVPYPTDKVHIIYLGRQLSTPTSIDRMPILTQAIGDGTTTQFSIPDAASLTEHGLLVFKERTMQRANTDFTITNNKITFFSPPESNTKLDFYVFGSERSMRLPLLDNSVATSSIQNESVTPEKLRLYYKDYPLLGAVSTFNITTFNGMNSTTMLNYARYQDLGLVVKVKASFAVVLSGNPDNKIRFSVPIKNDGDTNVLYAVTISTPSSVESGIIRWGSENEFDIYRQFAVNYLNPSLTSEVYTIELSLEYTTPPPPPPNP